MKICICGAGAIGGYLGVQLARADADVSLVARGAHFAAMRANGLKLLIGDEERVVRPRCTDNPAELGPQDFVIICLKAHSGATLDVICSDPATRALSKAIMLETQAIAETFGVKFRVDVERRIEGARKIGAHKTSMLQDLERGRPMEIDPLVAVVQEMGRLTGIPTPALDAVLALVAQRAGVAGALSAQCTSCGPQSPRFCITADTDLPPAP